MQCPGATLCNTGIPEKEQHPRHPHDLPLHNGLFYQLYDLTYDVWVFSHGGTEYKINRQSITPATRLLRDTLKEKCTGILRQLIERGILEDSVLA